MTTEPAGAPAAPLQFDVVTLFPPQVFAAVTQYGVTGRAFEQKRASLTLWNPRDFTENNHRTVDDRPYGGGPGMVMMAEPLERALDAAQLRQQGAGVSIAPVLCMSPQGNRLDHALVMELLKWPALTLIAGRYEGIDQRLLDRRVQMEVSIGDYVLSGGELAAMVLMDALVRQLPGVLNDADSAIQESFVTGLLDCPHYTRPEVYRDVPVPGVLLSGNHAAIARWRRKQALGRTRERRPDLLQQVALTAADRKLLAEYEQETGLKE